MPQNKKECSLLTLIMLLLILTGCSSTIEPTVEVQVLSQTGTPLGHTLDTPKSPTSISTPVEFGLSQTNISSENLLIFSDLSGIFTININTSEITVIKKEYLYDQVMLVNGQLFLLHSLGTEYGFGPSKVYRMNTDGTDELQLTFGESFEEGYSVSPDGKYLAFQSDEEDNLERYSISFLNLSTGIRKIISQSSNHPYKASSWSPDGKKLVFAMVSGTTSEHRFFVYEIDTGKLIELPIENSAINYLFGWSPDGMHIALSMKDEEGYGFFLYEISSNSFEKLISFEKEPYSIAWSNDGNKILLETLYEIPQDATYVKLELIDIRTGEAMTIEEGSVKSGFSHQPRWLSADNYFAYDMSLEDDCWAIVIVDSSRMKKFIFELPYPYSNYPSSWIITKSGE